MDFQRLIIFFAVSGPLFIGCKPRLNEKSIVQGEKPEEFLRCNGDRQPRGFALVVAGWGLFTEGHDFAFNAVLWKRTLENRGYCTVVLFPQQRHAFAQGPGEGEVQMPNVQDAERAHVPPNQIEEWLAEQRQTIEKLYYRDDVAYFHSLGLVRPDRNATEENIGRFFASVAALDLLPQQKRVFMALMAHGQPSDPQSEEPANNLSVYDNQFLADLENPDINDFCSSSGSHACTLSTCSKEQAIFQSRSLAPLFRGLSDQGFHSSLLVQSCFSGAARKNFAGIQNMCTVTSSIGSAPSHGCGEDDSPDNQDYTSTIDSIVWLLAQDNLVDMRQDPYLAAKSCFKKHDALSTHEHSPRPLSIYDAFIEARRTDKTWDHATISSFAATEYFARNMYSTNFQFSLPLNIEAIASNIDALISLTAGIDKKLFVEKKKTLLSAAAAYEPHANKVLEKGQAMQAVIRNNDFMTAEKISIEMQTIEPRAQKASEVFLAAERDLLDLVLRSAKISDKDPCAETL